MIRRSFLKLIAASPFLGLFKSRKSGASTGLTKIPVTFSGIMPVSKTDICNEALRQLGRHDPTPIITMEDMTSATSSEGPVFWTDGNSERHFPLEFNRLSRGNEEEEII